MQNQFRYCKVNETNGIPIYPCKRTIIDINAKKNRIEAAARIRMRIEEEAELEEPKVRVDLRSRFADPFITFQLRARNARDRAKERLGRRRK